MVKVVIPKGDQSGQAGVGGGPGPQCVIVVSVQVDVGIDEARQHQLSLSVDIFIGWWQQLLGSQGDYLLSGNGDGGGVGLRGGDHLAAPHNGVNSGIRHTGPPIQSG